MIVGVVGVAIAMTGVLVYLDESETVRDTDGRWNETRGLAWLTGILLVVAAGWWWLIRRWRRETSTQERLAQPIAAHERKRTGSHEPQVSDGRAEEKP
jgi:hypothetical protein